MKEQATLIAVGIGVLVTPVALLLAFISAGAGHGDYFYTIVLFPFTLLSVSSGIEIIGWVGLLFAFVQFPLYGVLLSKRRFLPAGVVLVVIHVALATLIWSGRLDQFL